ncbi:hypothetical protein [Haloarchaeobius amylolyticus]|uniref:hypothetical protein n=1 Tax=Haloarchaeobius amylolyticus TaxID=1198296 RepID=UPI00226F97E4|nr:hypothetical protein [Haloarchaeobius amylolyticus]
MSVAGLCQICEDARARQHCNRCGAMVCENHFDRDHGMCLDCASRADPRGVDEGADTYQF